MVPDLEPDIHLRTPGSFRGEGYTGTTFCLTGEPLLLGCSSFPGSLSG